MRYYRDPAEGVAFDQAPGQALVRGDRRSMNSLQRRLLEILGNIDVPVSPFRIRERCQIPQTEEVIACNLRGLVRAGRVVECSPNFFAPSELRPQPEPPARPTVNKEKRVSKKNNHAQPAKALVAEVPDMPSPGAVDAELALLSDLDQMATAAGGREVQDRETKVLVVERLADMALPSVAAVLRRIIDEDLAPTEA